MKLRGKYQGQLTRAAVELAKEWRSDRALRKLEAMLIVANTEATLLISGNGDVIEPEHGVLAIGSGGHYAHAAATALVENTELSAPEVVNKALMICCEHLRLHQQFAHHRNSRSVGGWSTSIHV